MKAAIRKTIAEKRNIRLMVMLTILVNIAVLHEKNSLQMVVYDQMTGTMSFKTDKTHQD